MYIRPVHVLLYYWLFLILIFVIRIGHIFYAFDLSNRCDTWIQYIEGLGYETEFFIWLVLINMLEARMVLEGKLLISKLLFCIRFANIDFGCVSRNSEYLIVVEFGFGHYQIYNLLFKIIKYLASSPYPRTWGPATDRTSSAYPASSGPPRNLSHSIWILRIWGVS